jgi:hypothetical protein
MPYRNKRKRHQSRQKHQSTGDFSNAWSTLQKIALTGWGSTARLALLLMIKQSPVAVLILLILRFIFRWWPHV